MTVEAVNRRAVTSEPTARSRPQQSWFNRNRSAIIRHGVINFFMVIILLPLAWVLMMSIKSLPGRHARRFLAAEVRLRPLQLSSSSGS